MYTRLGWRWDAARTGVKGLAKRGSGYPRTRGFRAERTGQRSGSATATSRTTARQLARHVRWLGAPPICQHQQHGGHRRGAGSHCAHSVRDADEAAGRDPGGCGRNHVPTGHRTRRSGPSAGDQSGQPVKPGDVARESHRYRRASAQRHHGRSGAGMVASEALGTHKA